MHIQIEKKKGDCNEQQEDPFEQKNSRPKQHQD